MLFFRVLDVRENGEIAPEYYLWDDQLEEEEDDFNWDDPACQSSRKNDTEEPDYRELMEGILEVCEEYGVNLVIPRT